MFPMRMFRPVLRQLRFPRALLCGALALALVAACAGSTRQARQQIEAGDLEAAEDTLEQQRAANPDAAGVRVALGETYYRKAREALDRGDEAEYLAYLERATNEFVQALELEPRDHQPHFYLAVIDAYRGELSSALRGFNNARKLQPSGTAYTNIAEIFVYMGRIPQAYEWNDLGLRKRAPYSAYVFNEMLLEWKAGNIEGARRKFATLKTRYPEAISTINVAKLPETPQTFEAFAGYCCDSPACGPYMVEACTELELAVRQRKISEESVLKELRIEIERKRRLKKVYDQRKELEITIDETPESAPAEKAQ